MHYPQDAVYEPLYVVTCIFNPERFKSRAKHYRDFQARVRQAGAQLLTVEASTGNRDFEVRGHAPAVDGVADIKHKSHGPAHVPPSEPLSNGQDYVRLQTGDNQQIWLKENLLNLGVQRLPSDWKYVAFVDADIAFARPDWVSETLHQLQRFHVVQMFETAVDLGPTGNPLLQHKGFGWCHSTGAPGGTADAGAYCSKGPGRGRGADFYWHPGFAWAWRREAFNGCGGLLETGLLGAGDRHMADALAGATSRSYHPDMSAGYKRSIQRWEARAEHCVRRNIGYVAGTIWHSWHGKKVDRKYWDRWKVLIKHGYDPETDLERDWQGVLRLTHTKPGLRDDCRRYFGARNEDSIDE